MSGQSYSVYRLVNLYEKMEKMCVAQLARKGTCGLHEGGMIMIVQANPRLKQPRPAVLGIASGIFLLTGFGAAWAS